MRTNTIADRDFPAVTNVIDDAVGVGVGRVNPTAYSE